MRCHGLDTRTDKRPNVPGPSTTPTALTPPLPWRWPCSMTRPGKDRPSSPLRYWQMIEINQPGAQRLITSPLRADERIVSAMKGLNYLDDRLTPLLVPMERTEPTSMPDFAMETVRPSYNTWK